MLGAYLTYNFHVTWGLPFCLAVVLAVVGQRARRRRWSSGLCCAAWSASPSFALIMITIGMLFVYPGDRHDIWGFDGLEPRRPLGGRDRRGRRGRDRGSPTCGRSASPLAVVRRRSSCFFRFTSLGLAMRATALDQEAALAQGISAAPGRSPSSWAIAGGVAALAGVTLAAGPGGVNPQVGFIALLAFPAMILGGLDSPRRRGASAASSSASPRRSPPATSRSTPRCSATTSSRSCPTW